MVSPDMVDTYYSMGSHTTNFCMYSKSFKWQSTLYKAYHVLCGTIPPLAWILVLNKQSNLLQTSNDLKLAAIHVTNRSLNLHSKSTLIIALILGTVPFWRNLNAKIWIIRTATLRLLNFNDNMCKGQSVIFENPSNMLLYVRMFCNLLQKGEKMKQKKKCPEYFHTQICYRAIQKSKFYQKKC